MYAGIGNGGNVVRTGSVRGGGIGKLREAAVTHGEGDSR